jgi:hypothetical protein
MFRQGRRVRFLAYVLAVASLGRLAAHTQKETTNNNRLSFFALPNFHDDAASASALMPCLAMLCTSAHANAQVAQPRNACKICALQ